MQYINRKQSPTKLTLIQASMKKNEKKLFVNIKDKRQKEKPNFKTGDLDRTSDIRSVFSKGDSTNYSCELHAITQTVGDTKFSYRIKLLPERYNHSLLGSTNSTIDEDTQDMKKKIQILTIGLNKGNYLKMRIIKNIVEIACIV